MHVVVQSLFLTNVSGARSGIGDREAAAPIAKIDIRAGSATKVGVPSVFIKRARRVAPVFPACAQSLDWRSSCSVGQTQS